jgi:2-polyprenyl-3-methyl-5-hydroxy-6-metoxy-1,4-benzoquinol methylase
MDARYAAVYPELYRYHWWWRVRERMLISTLRRIAPLPTARILDVGCGGGLFFGELQEFGDVSGIEADPASVGQDNQWAHRIVCGELDESYIPPAPFDLILMLDVLEHVANVGKILANVGRILAVDGRVVVTVPAFEWLWTSHDDMNHHVKRYTADDLRSTLQASGLAVFETRYLFQSLVFPKLAVRLSESTGLRRPDVPSIPGATISAALQSWFWAEYRWLGRLPFGTSVLAVAGLPPRAG